MKSSDRLAMYVRGELPPGPEMVHIDLTNACNLDCVTCWNYSPHLDTPKSGAWKRQTLDYDLFCKVAEDLTAMGVERVILSGSGEPFFHPRIYDVLAELQRRKIHVTIITNGTVTDWDRILALGVRQLLLNTSAASAASYVAFHPNQREDTWHRLCAGTARVAPRIFVNQVQVICSVNWREVPAMIDLAADLGAARVSYKLANLAHGTEAVAITHAEREELCASLLPEALRRAKVRGVRHNLDVLGSQLRGESPTEFPIEEVGCHAGHFYSRVYVDGRVFYCCEHIEVGRLSEMPFREVWRSERYDRMRDRLQRGGYFPGCARCGKYELNYKVHEALTALGAALAPARAAALRVLP
jgi:MoaA/NifB/PqqE/SkfB family radical SAM enzyme